MRLQEVIISKMSETPHSKELTLDYAKKLFFLSFRFSQGHTPIQTKIFEYLHYLRPQWKMSDDLKEQVVKKVRSSITKFLKGNGKVTLHVNIVSSVDTTIDSQANKMQECLNSKIKKLPDIFSIADNIIQRDFMYLTRQNGRKRTPALGDAKYSPVLDPFLSYTCYYGFERKSTGVEEYDEMFKEVSLLSLKILQGDIPQYVNQETSEVFKDKLTAVIKKYAQTHPQSAEKLKSLGVLSRSIA